MDQIFNPNISDSDSQSRRCIWVNGPVIVGAGPSGLAVGACLREQGVPFVVLERADCIASLWQKRAYNRLKLHLPKQFCQLPKMDFPDSFPEYPTKGQFVEYLESYATRFDIAPRFNECVESAKYDETLGLWRVLTSTSTWGQDRPQVGVEVEYVCRWLVVATGENAECVVPEIDGLGSFKGKVVHSSEYKSGEGYRGQKVIVVGSGNSGMEVSLDLSNHNALPSMVCRSSVHVLPREIMGKSTFEWAMFLMKWLPLWLVDKILLFFTWFLLGDIEKYGLNRPKTGPMELKNTQGKTPVLDVGALAKIRAGDIKVVPGIKCFSSNGVELDNGEKMGVDSVILATGYRSNVPSWLKESDLFNKNGFPKTPFPNAWKGKSGLYAVGFTRRGLAGVSSDAVKIAQDIGHIWKQEIQHNKVTAPRLRSYVCNHIAPENQCNTFAVLNSNPYYSSLYNLSYYLGIDRVALAAANGFSSDTEYLPVNQPLLIPIECKCAENGFFRAGLVKTVEKGETFFGISQSLEGLTTCKAIIERNVGVSPWNVPEKIKVNVPVRCGCPTVSDISSGIRMLVSYPVISGDFSVTSLANNFNVTVEDIISVNKRTKTMVENLSLSVLIPLKERPLLGSLALPREPDLRFPSQRNVSGNNNHKKKKKKKRKEIMILGICIGFGCLGIAGILLGLAYFLRMRRKEQEKRLLSSKMVDVELQQLSLSIRTTSEKKVSFEGSQSTLDGQVIEPTTPRNMVRFESYALDELKKSTENFDSHNLIEGNVYHGRVKGKNLAIKCTTIEYISKVDLTLFQDTIHNHPSIMRVLGSCVTEDTDSYLVFEYAKNGSLKDWIHGGLAMKSHFIASCSCFLTWKQRLKICLDVALALQYMHHIMHPVYIHRNIKSRNIFLDEEFNAKVGNFGMAKCVEGEIEENTEFCSRNPVSWSKGYLAPEYINQGTITPSIDIFSYGVVLLEILSGETPVICQKEDENIMLFEKVKSILQSEDVDEFRGWIDKDLGENYPFDGAMNLANLARECVDDEPSLRPSAGEIVEKLSRLVEESPAQDQQFLINESSSKPLVLAAASNSG
ncbi:hypothetical protein KSS87_002669 [Heliosperma pusillum]|nr:hypothetical protein KSS87_002669 [Heliosperma pusillum]